MNKDDQTRPDFAYARMAAIYRTRIEWRTLAESLTDNEKAALTGGLAS